MGLPRTFVGFSSTDINLYWLMRAWKKNQNIDFDFVDCQLQDEINSDDEKYIKTVCRQRIMLASRFVMLIGNDTRYKHKYVLWEAEVAEEKDCIIIGVNLNGSRKYDSDLCPKVIKDIGAIFVSYSPQIIAYAIENWQMQSEGNYEYKDSLYVQLGY